MFDYIYLLDHCGGLLPILRVIALFIKILMILIPIALILFGTIDLGRAVIESDEKKVKEAQKRLIQRFIYAALIFFIPMLVGVIMNLVAQGGEVGNEETTEVPTDAVSWKQCWNEMNGR